MTVSAQERIANLVDVRDQLRRDFDEFRTTVREHAIAAHRNGHWGRAALNGALTELGLALYEPRYRFQLVVPIEATLPADDEDDAHAEARDLADRLQPALSEAVDALGLSYTAEVARPWVDDVTETTDIC